MKTDLQLHAPHAAPVRKLAELRRRLADAEAALHGIQSGEVDTVVIEGQKGSRIFTLEGVEQGYRALIEAMNEGALTLTTDAVILYANQGFARMIKSPLERVISGTFFKYLSPDDQIVARQHLKRKWKSDAKFQMLLRADDGSQLPALISICPLPTSGGADANIGIVVTDMTETRRSEERLRSLSQRLVDLQENERRSVALELHENISQLTYAILMRCDALANKLPTRASASRAELLELRDLLDKATGEVRRIARDLRPAALDDIGLVPVLRMTCKQFAQRAHTEIDLSGVRNITRLPAAVETALYRILQEVLNNVEQHAHARHVSVGLQRKKDTVQLMIIDDGVGFDHNSHPAQRRGKNGLGLFSLRERAVSVGGTLEVKSAPGEGTTIRADIPCGHDDLSPKNL